MADLVIKTLFRDAVRSAQYAGWERGKLGRQDPNTGAWELVAPGNRNTVYVRVLRGDEITIIEALNQAVAAKVGLDVWIGPSIDGITEVKGVVAASVSAITGGKNAGLAVAPHSHAIGSGLEWIIEPKLFQPGLVHATYPASMSVDVEPFFYLWSGDLKYYAGGTLNLTANKPATAGYEQWTLVCLDGEAGTLTGLDGTAVPIVTPVSIADIADIDPGDDLPLGAVKLTAGMTAITDNARYVDARLWVSGAMPRLAVSTANVSNPPLDAELDAAFGEPGTVGEGFVRLVDDAGAHAHEYLVWSDGAAWWYAEGTQAL